MIAEIRFFMRYFLAPPVKTNLSQVKKMKLAAAPGSIAIVYPPFIIYTKIYEPVVGR